jgi:uncharacterized protein YjeT (DUF2065 family)
MAIELFTFLGLVIVVEGVLLALFPAALARMMRDMAAQPPERLRRIGLVAAVGGAAFLLILAGWLADDGATAGLGFPRLRALLGHVLSGVAG